jgi:hypothetical protein
MIRAENSDSEVEICLSKAQALVLFEWLVRNWETGCLEEEKNFADPAEKQVLMWLDGALQKVLTEPFDPNYRQLLNAAMREIVSDPSEWE